jgi:predicted ester cyclase
MIFVNERSFVVSIYQGEFRMSEEKNKDFIRRYFETFDGKEKAAARLKEYMTESGEVLIEHILAFEAAFPHYQLAIEDMIAEGDKVVVRATFRGRHKGDLLYIPPTGKEVILPLIVIYCIADGKIDESWLVINQLDMMQQLGVIPATAAAA